MSTSTHSLASEKEARDVAEAARETEWQHPSFVRELFLVAAPDRPRGEGEGGGQPRSVRGVGDERVDLDGPVGGSVRIPGRRSMWRWPT